jgi:pyridoxal phosphate enzyme (YggS family)
VRAAYAAGQRDFGENYVQEAVAKIQTLAAEMPEARWHLIGRLQSNKAAVAVPVFSLLHAIDSSSAAAAVARAAQRAGRTADVLLQIRLGERGSAGARERGGVEPGEAASFLEKAGLHAGVKFAGLMGVADPDLEARPQFAGLRELAERLGALGLAHAPLGELSMGMTGDFEEAVREGATLVRIGTAIFGERPRG